MHIYQKKLNERVFFHAYRDKRFKSASISLHYFMPYEPNMTAALCLLPALMKRGCYGYPTLADIAKGLERLFGSDILHYVRKRGKLLEITFRLEAIEDSYLFSHPPIWLEATQLLKDIIYRPAILKNDFSLDILEQEKNSMIDSILDIYNNKDAYALMRAAETLFPDTIYSTRIKGTPEAVSQITRDDLLIAYEYFLKNATLHIYYSGSKTVHEVLEYVSDIPQLHRGASVTFSPYVDTNSVEASPIIKETAADAEQSHVVVSYKLPIAALQDLKPGALALHNSILGYSPVSRLYQEVREKSGLCYSCSLVSNSLYGVYLVEAGVQPGREDEAIERIKEQFDAMKNGDFAHTSFAVALESIASASRSIISSPSQLENHYFTSLLSNTPYEPSKIRAASREVVREDIMLVARELQYVGSYVLLGGTTNE